MSTKFLCCVRQGNKAFGQEQKHLNFIIHSTMNWQMGKKADFCSCLALLHQFTVPVALQVPGNKTEGYALAVQFAGRASKKTI
jgi:hypothetical protein